MCLCRYMCHRIPVEVRGEFCGVDSVLVPLSEFQELNSVLQHCAASTLPAEASPNPCSFFVIETCFSLALSLI